MQTNPQYNCQPLQRDCRFSDFSFLFLLLDYHITPKDWKISEGYFQNLNFTPTLTLSDFHMSALSVGTQAEPEKHDGGTRAHLAILLQEL